MALVDAASCRVGDQAAVAAGDTHQQLMRRAAGHLARTTIEVAGGGYARRVVVLVGKGDNGGDGWAAAGLLADAGAHVTVVAPLSLTTEGSEAAVANREAWLRRGGVARGDLDGIEGLLAGADVVVDALLGTGSHGPVTGVLAQAVTAIASCRVPIVACDLPTGVDADTGAVDGPVVTADVTVTFGALTRGLVLHPGAAHAGRIVVASLGPRYPALDSSWAALTASGAGPDPVAAGHDKRDRGVALAVAGAAGTSGAAALCAAGLQAGGAGLVTVAVPSGIAAGVAALVPAAMTRSLPSAEMVSPDAVHLLEDVTAFDVVVAGPGLGPTPGTRAVIDHLRAHARALVLDADALNVHRGDAGPLAEHAGHLVITPHARELARLAGTDHVGLDRAGAAAELAKRLDCTVVAKGPGTIVAAADGRVWVTPVGDVTLATGGTGDVLAGMVAAAIAGADDVPAAVARAVWQHGFAGQLAGRRRVRRVPADAFARSVPAALDELARLAVRRPAWPLDGAGDELERL